MLCGLACALGAAALVGLPCNLAKPMGRADEAEAVGRMNGTAWKSSFINREIFSAPGLALIWGSPRADEGMATACGETRWCDCSTWRLQAAGSGTGNLDAEDYAIGVPRPGWAKSGPCRKPGAAGGLLHVDACGPRGGSEGPAGGAGGVLKRYWRRRAPVPGGTTPGSRLEAVANPGLVSCSED